MPQTSREMPRNKMSAHSFEVWGSSNARLVNATRRQIKLKTVKFWTLNGWHFEDFGEISIPLILR